MNAKVRKKQPSYIGRDFYARVSINRLDTNEFGLQYDHRKCKQFLVVDISTVFKEKYLLIQQKKKGRQSGCLF